MSLQPIPLSIVIAASNDVPSLRRCLESLRAQAIAENAEVIVVSNYLPGDAVSMNANFPFATFVGLPAETTVPQLRSRGIAESRGAIVALLEDHGWADPRWCAEIKAAHRLPYAAVGGAVENAEDSHLLDWAVYFYDYGKYMTPNKEGPAATLPGNNVSYKRTALDKVRASFSNDHEGFYETFIHEELKRQGQTLYLAPAAIIFHQKRYGARQMLSQFYHHARAYAGKRGETYALLKRIAMTLGSLLLPVLLTTRIAARTCRKGRHQQALWLSLPCIFLLMTSWAGGEFAGYLLGVGDSARHWK